MDHSPRVLVASDKFKGSLTAVEVGAAVSAGLRAVVTEVEVTVVPIADGGDGTLAAAISAGYDEVEVTVSGPTRIPNSSAYARQGATAVVELADACGLVRLPDSRPAPMTASSRGAGELLAAAIDAGCTRIVLGIGGSASTDGGAGLLRALGAVVRDADGADIGEGGAGLATAASIDLTALRERVAGVGFLVACDVDNPLTGPRGAAAVYGPQKGASEGQVVELDDALKRWADLLAAATGADHREVAGAGAAGGVGFAAIALLGAQLVPGIELVLDLVGFADRVADVDLVITGEGALDEQTLHGKAPAGVAEAATRAGARVVAVCGVNMLSSDRMQRAGIEAAYALSDIESDRAVCFSDADRLLTVLGERIAADILVGAARRA